MRTAWPRPTGRRLGFFGNDPWWLVLVKAVFIFAFLLLTVLVAIVWERKVVGLDAAADRPQPGTVPGACSSPSRTA